MHRNAAPIAPHYQTMYQYYFIWILHDNCNEHPKACHAIFCNVY